MKTLILTAVVFGTLTSLPSFAEEKGDNGPGNSSVSINLDGSDSINREGCNIYKGYSDRSFYVPLNIVLREKGYEITDNFWNADLELSYTREKMSSVRKTFFSREEYSYQTYSVNLFDLKDILKEDGTVQGKRKSLQLTNDEIKYKTWHQADPHRIFEAMDAEIEALMVAVNNLPSCIRK
jgi:hypothetical protein